MTTFDEYASRQIKVLSNIDRESIKKCLTTIRKTVERDGVVWFAGNGGSASTASHASCDFSKGISLKSGSNIRAFSLVDSQSTFTAWANDYSYETALAEMCRINLRKHDCLVLISGSGNSTNILAAARVANEMNVKVIALTGFDGGRLSSIVEECINIPSDDMQVIENLHLMIIHWFLQGF